MTVQETSTIQTQELIYKRRIERMRITQGHSRGELIDRVNAVSQDKRLPSRTQDNVKVRRLRSSEC